MRLSSAMASGDVAPAHPIVVLTLVKFLTPSIVVPDWTRPAVAPRLSDVPIARAQSAMMNFNLVVIIDRLMRSIVSLFE